MIKFRQDQRNKCQVSALRLQSQLQLQLHQEPHKPMDDGRCLTPPYLPYLPFFLATSRAYLSSWLLSAYQVTPKIIALFWVYFYLLPPESPNCCCCCFGKRKQLPPSIFLLPSQLYIIHSIYLLSSINIHNSRSQLRWKLVWQPTLGAPFQIMHLLGRAWSFNA